VADLTSAFDPKAYYSPRVVLWIDRASWAVPAVAAVLSGIAGWQSMPGQNPSIAAWCGIGGGVVSAAGVWVTNYSSRIRDAELRRAQALADIAQGNADMALARLPLSF